MQRVVLLVYHGASHFNAFLGLARHLQAKYDIIFAGVEFFQQYVISQGFRYYSLKTVPFGMGFEYWLNTVRKKKMPGLAAIKDRITDALYKQREKELQTLMHKLTPELILLDSHQGTDFIVLHPMLEEYSSCVALIHTYLPSDQIQDCPPINSTLMPEDKSAIRCAQALQFTGNIATGIFDKIRYLGFDNRCIINRNRKANKIPADYFSKTSSLLTVNLKGLPEFILSSKEFDYKENVIEGRNYIGPFVDKERVEIADVSYLEIAEAIRSDLQHRKRPLIYCSFGTVKSKSGKSVIKFFERLAQVCFRHDYVLIVATDKIDFTPREKLKNIHFFKRVPQLEVLSMANVFITHGGFNSIKEAIDAQVPMLVYLANSYSDQPGNSSRVVYHQIGIRGKLNSDNESVIASRINDLLTNPVYKEHLIKMKAAESNYPPANVSALLDEIINGASV